MLQSFLNDIHQEQVLEHIFLMLIHSLTKILNQVLTWQDHHAGLQTLTKIIKESGRVRERFKERKIYKKITQEGNEMNVSKVCTRYVQTDLRIVSRRIRFY